MREGAWTLPKEAGPGAFLRFRKGEGDVVLGAVVVAALAGAAGVAVVSAVMAAPDPAEAARGLLAAVEAARSGLRG